MTSRRRIGYEEERINYLNWEFDRVANVMRDDRDRLFENIRLWSGINDGQWDDWVRNLLRQEDRNVKTLNVLAQKIAVLVGSLRANPFYVRFVPTNGEMSQLIEDFRDIYISDKHTQRWDVAELDCLRYGVGCGHADEQLIIDRSRDPEGRLRFVFRQPGTVMYDAFWKSSDTEDCSVAWCFTNMTLERISELYDIPVKALQTELNIQNLMQREFDKDTVSIRFNQNEQNVYNRGYQVREKHEMKQKKGKKLVDYSKGYSGLTFPMVDDREYLIAWGNKNDVNWDYVEEVPFKYKELHITSWCPYISRRLMLEDKPSEIQIGRLDLFPYTGWRINGVDHGIIDVAKDPQRLLNENETLKQYMIANAAKGATILNSDLTGGDEDKMEDIKNNWTKANFMTDAPLDDIKTPFIKLKEQTYDPALSASESTLIDIINLITPVPAAMSSQTESDRESGKLYQSKIAVAEVGMRMLNDGWRQHNYDKASAYFRQAKLLYRDRYRQFPKITASGDIMPGATIEVNVNVGGAIINDISAIPDCEVIVREDQNGMITRTMNRTTFMEMLQFIPPDLALLRTKIVDLIIKTLDIGDDEKATFESLTTLELQNALRAHVAQGKNSEAAAAQAEMLIQQVSMQLQGPQQQLPQQATPTEGQPVEPTPQEVAEVPQLQAPPAPSSPDLLGRGA